MHSQHQHQRRVRHRLRSIASHDCTPGICPTTLACQLDREWGRLRHGRASLRHVRNWRTDDPELDRWVRQRLDGVRDLDQVVDLLDRRFGSDADRLLHWLLDVARTQPLAGRLVLQRILPVVISQTVRRQCVRQGDPVSEAIAAATIAIASYDCSTLPHHIAPRLVSAALHEAFRKPQRRRAHTSEFPVGPPTFVRIQAPPDELDQATAADRVLAAGAAAGVDDQLLDIARRLALGESTAHIAAARRCTDRAIRQQRMRVIARLRDRLDSSWSDWWDPLTGIEFAPAT